jgi:hypothetical protein
MVVLLKRLAPREGYALTALPDVRFLRSDRPLASTPVLYEPGIVIVCQESASQFSREFKRFFGLSPSDEIVRLKSSFAMPPSPGKQAWVTSH